MLAVVRSLRPVGVKLEVASQQPPKSLGSLTPGTRRPLAEPIALTAEVLLRDVLTLLVGVLEDSPELAQRLAAFVGTRAPAAHGLLVTRVEYARRLSYSVRQLGHLIAAGLPTVGKGRALRIPIEAADQWVMVHLGQRTEENELELAAFASARRRTHRGSR